MQVWTQRRVGPISLPQVRIAPSILFSYLFIGLIALAPRTLDLGGFVNIDEINHWIGRAGAFLLALRTGDYAATAISKHPGVTTMWLGAAGIILREQMTAWGLLQSDPFPVVLALLRLPVALAHTLAILLGYHLLRRLLPALTAALAAALWALDPLVIAYSRILHVDALAGTFATLSLLTACLYWGHTRHPAALTLSAVCGALAMLSKLPAVAVVPIVGLIAVAEAWNQAGLTARLRRAALPLLAWVAVCGITALLIWPALWANPARVYELFRYGLEDESSRFASGGNYFLGRADPDPGWLYYPLALAMRQTPWTLLGLLLLPWAWRRSGAGAGRDMLALLGFTALFLFGLSLFINKLTRYITPVLPAVDILAAIGLGWAAGVLGPRLQALGVIRPGAQHGAGAVMGVVALAAAMNVAAWHPYSIAYFNPLTGGARAGVQTFLTGWGEGMEQAAAWLNEQPDITGVVTISFLHRTLAPYMLPRTEVVDAYSVDEALPEKAGYLVVTRERVQTGPLAPPLDLFYGHVPPVHTVRIHGAEYAWIYQIPPAAPRATSADFGPALRLHGFDVPAEARRGEPLTLRLFWAPRATLPTDYMLFAHLLGPDGQRVAQLDLPLPTASWQAGRYPLSEVPLALPADAPPGSYRLFIGLYDPATGQRLPIAAEQPIDPALDGPDALLLGEVLVE